MQTLTKKSHLQAVPSDSEDEIVRRYAPMARRLASRMTVAGAEFDDLLQVANLALIKAFRAFDQERGDFPPFAHATISGELKKYLRDYCWSVRPPRRVQELQAQVRTVAADVTQRVGRPAQPSELARELGTTVGDVSEALTAGTCMFPASLDQPPTSGARPLSDVLADSQDAFEHVESVVAVSQLCRDLRDEDRELIRLRFYEGLSQREMALRLGVSQMQVCRRLNRLLSVLRDRAVAA